MAKSSVGTTALAGCVSAATLLAPGLLFQSPAPATPQTREITLRGAAQQRTTGSSSFSQAATVTAAASLGVAALAASKSLRAPRVARRAEAKFAGGLIGGESAFASGDYNFDPMGLSTKCEKFLPWFREAELKHGRICMLAWVGLVVPEIVRIPGPEQCYTASVVDAHNACIGDGTFQNGPLAQVFLFCAVIEMTTTFPKCVQGLTLENAGDYKLGLNFLPDDAAKAQEMKLKELKNGRLAMMAFGGAVTQAVLSGNGFPWLYADRSQSRKGAGLTSSIPSARNCAVRGKVAMKAEGGYKMSKAVPFLPVSPALEGYVGEEEGFDPIGMSLAFDIAWLREAELKHGRVAMLATVGWITTDLGFRVPGDMFQVSTIEAHDAMVKFGSMPQLLVWIGYLEVFGFLAFNNAAEGRTDREPGDFGLRWLYPKDEAGQKDMQLKELRNGRLAMLAYGGIVTAAVLTGKTWPFLDATAERQSSTFATGSALCGGLQGRTERGTAVAARAMERSRSLPFLPKPANLAGYVGEEAEFDPLGFSDTFDMKWLREAELKHGRVCMMATVGFLAQQYITFPGFTPTENALNAVYTAQPSGMATLLFLAGYIESTSYGGKLTMLDMFEGDREPGYHFNFGSGFLKGKTDAQVTEMKMKELNNGRLAMLGFSGMVHHNLVVKGPLFPTFPDGWTGPQGSWELDSVFGRLNTPGAASTWGA